jgi:hypothetical protein
MKISVRVDAVFMDAIVGIRSPLAYRGRLIRPLRTFRFPLSSPAHKG